MKKIVILLLVIVVLLAGCSSQNTIETENNENTASMFVVVEETDRWYVVYDKDNLCMYTVSRGGYNLGNFTLLVNADGTPKLWNKE